MNHEQAMAFMLAPSGPGSTLELDVIECLLEELGSPHKDLKYVHVAGTNGKGSACAFISSILTAAGYKTGLFTSPYLRRFNEYIRIDGSEIPDIDIDEFADILSDASERVLKRGLRRPSAFELAAALAFLYFKKCACDIVVLEVGMGGRLDATNVIERSEVSVITNIGYDHMEYLGDTLGKIAAEKAGIIKPNGQVVLYAQSEAVEKVIAEVCADRGATLALADAALANIKSISLDGIRFDYGPYENLMTTLPGVYQVNNAVTAITAAQALIKAGYRIDERHIRSGLAGARWPGRLELLHKGPAVVIDGAHNPQGVAALTESLKALFPGQKLRFIVGMLADKDYTGSIRTVLPLAKAFFTVTPPNPRALSAQDLASEIRKLGDVPAAAFDSIPAAIDAALSSTPPDEAVCIFGSLYQVGDVRAYFERKSL